MSDIFISYAHIDNQPLTEGQRGWIARFHQNLETRLSQLLGERPIIWRDPKLTGSDNFGTTIIKQLPEAKVMLSVLSPRYVKSEWCVREAAEFYRAAESAGGVRVRNKSRLIKIVKTPVPLNEIPQPLNGVFVSQLGFEFFELDAETGRPHEFSEEFGPEAERHFHERIYDLACDLRDLLQLIRGGPAAVALSGKTVYLAATTSDLQTERERLQRELSERGHVVLPDAPLPMVASELEQAVRDGLAKADLAVHLVGSRYGLVPEDGDCSIVEFQNRLAAARSAAGPFPRIIWLPRGLEPHDDRQKAFVRRLFDDAAAQAGAEVLQDTIERLKDLVLERLNPQPKPAPVAPVTTAGGAPTVYLICDQRDGAAPDPVEDFLFDQGLEVCRSSFEGNEAEVGAAHRQYLQACDAAFIYYGGGSRAWVDVKLLDLLQAPGFGRTKPWRAKAVCLAAPDDRQKQRFRTHAAEVIRLGETFAPELLSPFVQSVKAAPA